MTFGSEIVESFYDYDSQMIGPYKVPIEIQYNADSCQGNAFSKYTFYELMNKEEGALAVFNVNNYCFCVLYKDAVRMKHYTVGDLSYNKKELPCFSIEPPLDVPEYKHVGWVKTYQKCIAVYTWPWKMIEDTQTKTVWGFKDKLLGEPLENPPLSLYKELISTEHKGVYIDKNTNQVMFLD